MAAQLDGDALDDLIVFARDYSNPSKIDYQEDRVSTFLTVYDSNWNSCSNGTKKPYFPWAPPYPPQPVDPQALATYMTFLPLPFPLAAPS